MFSMRDWSLAYVLALAEDPPSTLFSEKMNTLSAAGRPFSPLVPPGLALTNLAYIKELEVLSTRRFERHGSRSAKGSGCGGRDRQPEETKASGSQRLLQTPGRGKFLSRLYDWEEFI